jgi:adenosylmethionine-8-amino-7-oxononanoate aminotransferase
LCWAAAAQPGLCYPGINRFYFTTGGAESNESAFKTARYYWKLAGKPDKYKVISRVWGYYGVTLAAMSATGIASYWPMFKPQTPGFVHIESPYPYRFQPSASSSDSPSRCPAANRPCITNIASKRVFVRPHPTASIVKST